MHRLSMSFGLIIVITVLGLIVKGSNASASFNPTNLVVTAPGASGVILPEMDEYATTVLGDPWDMNEPTDLAYYYREASQMTDSGFSNGVYSAKMTEGDGRERITLLTAGAQNNAAMRIGKIGYNFPINADHYRYLTFRLYSSNNTCNSGAVRWIADDSYTSSGTATFSVPPDDPPGSCLSGPFGWHTYVIDLTDEDLGSLSWSDTIRELIIHPFAGNNAAGKQVKLDWVRLTAEDPNSARPYTIRWTGTGNGGAVTLYASRNDKTLDDDDIIIATGQSANGGSYEFQTGVLPAGLYYIAASNNSGTAWSSGPLIINAPPQATITRPSMTSGEDYATTVLGNAWDMNDITDLNDVLPSFWETCVNDESFAYGRYQASITPCPDTTVYVDSKLILGHLNPPGGPDPVVDTSKYRYFSFRFRHSGTQNVAEGWVARFGWWQVNENATVESPVMSRDIILLEGWNTYKIDLFAPDVVDEEHAVQIPWIDSAPNRLRFDPTELYVSRLPATIELDWITLTAMDEVNRGETFPIQYRVTAQGPVNLTFYYDTDRNPDNGRTLIETTAIAGIHDAPQAYLAGAYQVFIPTAVKIQVGCHAPTCYDWNTANVAEGTYYICIESEDAYNSTYRCSEAPLMVR